MKVNKKTITVEHSGSSDYYDGALVAGEFIGRKYYAIDDVCKALGVTQDQLADIDLDDQYNEVVTMLEMIQHNCEPVRSVGHIIA